MFVGRVTAALTGDLARQGIRKREFNYYFNLCGTKSLPTVLTIAFLMGVVLAVQSAIQLRKVGGEIFTIDLVGFAVMKEFGPLTVAIIAIGRAGSAFAAEIGAMKVNDEINALETLGIRPESFLVTPKLAAMLCAMPLLTVFSDLAGILGGMAIGVTVLDIPAEAYWEGTWRTLDITTFLLGWIKSFTFGTLITLAGCYFGFQSSSDAQGVGRAATDAVVASIFLIVISDTLFTVLYSFIGY